MVLLVAVLLAVVAVALAVTTVRARRDVAALTEQLGEARRAHELAEAAARTAEASAAAAAKERDDALERASRARRDAAEVARRMQEEAAARATVEADHRSVLEDRARLEEELAAAEAAAATGGEAKLAELWSLALAGVQRTWEISVSPSPGMASPLEDRDALEHAGDELRTALEIEVDAAREEAGAAIELEWQGRADVPVAICVRALSIGQELIARLAKVADDASLHVEVTDEALVLTVRAVDAAGNDVVPPDVAPAHLSGPGRYVLRRRNVAVTDPSYTGRGGRTPPDP